MAQSPAAVQSETYELEVIRLVNLERTSRGIAPLLRNSNLTSSARLHNQDMIDHHFFGHTGSDGSLPWDRACRSGFAPYGWGDCYVGENIGYGYSTPAKVVAAWMTSTSGHREAILDSRYHEVGVGHTVSGYAYWTMDLGSQPLVLPVFINNGTSTAESRQVTLTLTREEVSSSGSLGNITGVQISEDPDFAGASWQPWSQSKPFTLSAGNGSKTIYVRFTDGNKTVITTVVITLNEPVPSLSVSAARIGFLAKVGASATIPLEYRLKIENTGADTLYWTVSKSQSWLKLGSNAGSAPAEVRVWVDAGSGILGALGIATDTITVVATNADAVNTPQTITVTLHVVEEIYSVYLPLVGR